MISIKINYDHKKKHTEIIYHDKTMNTERIEGMTVREWIYPFLIKGIRWKGIYAEIKQFLDGQEKFIVIFEGTEQDRKLIETALADTSARVSVPNTKVIILYRTEPLMTRITINGKAFDTSRLENRTIDQWIQPFEIGEHVWKGVFQELEEEIGTTEYSVQFSGNPKDMLELVNFCPETVNIAYKEQNAKITPDSGGDLDSVVKTVGEKISTLKSSEKLTAMIQSENMQNIKATALEAGRRIDESVSNAAENIRNSNQYQNAMENLRNSERYGKVNKIAEFWNRLNKGTKYGIYIVAILLVIAIPLNLIFGNRKQIDARSAKNMLQVFIDHNGEEFLNHIPASCKKATLEHYRMSKEELAETLSTFADPLFGAAYEWDFSIEDKAYTISAQNIRLETVVGISLADMMNWKEERKTSLENDLNVWVTMDSTIDKIEGTAEVWDDIYDVSHLCFVVYVYDEDYIENKTDTKGFDEDEKLTLTFARYKGKWYCLEIMNIVTHCVEKNKNTEANKKQWEKYFGNWT